MEFIRNLCLVVSRVTHLRVGLYEVRLTASQAIFPFSKTPTPVLAPTQPSVQSVTLAVLPEVKRRVGVGGLRHVTHIHPG